MQVSMKSKKIPLLSSFDKTIENQDTSVWTDKRKSMGGDPFGPVSEHFLLFTDCKRRKSELSNGLTSIIENRSSERSQSSIRPTTPNNTNHSGSSKTMSNNLDAENVREIKVLNFEKIKRGNKETIV